LVRWPIEHALVTADAPWPAQASSTPSNPLPTRPKRMRNG